MLPDFQWIAPLELDVRFGYLEKGVDAPQTHNPKLVLNGDETNVLTVIRSELLRCTSFAFSVAFVSTRAIALLKQELVDFRDRGSGTGQIVTSDYLAFNSPAAFAELLNLRQLGIDVRLHNSDSFHPKGYVFTGQNEVTALIGSTNLTETALVTNHEWNLRVAAHNRSDLAEQLRTAVQQQAAQSAPLTFDWISGYAQRYVAPPARPKRGDGLEAIGLTADEARIEPNQMQRDALKAIADVRASGEQRALVISATGTGKTILSALDARAFNPKRFLFIVHREQILDRTIESYQRVLGGSQSDYGKLAGSTRQTDRRYLFATVQTLAKPATLRQFSPDTFDYIVIDETHRAGAEQHRALIDYFKPSFLMGMTATPERTDGFNVFELFDYNVPYEIRLNDALEADMLVPFHYYGIADVAYEGDVSTSTDLGVLISADRVNHLVEALELYGQAGVPPRGLIFCSRKDEAHALSAALNRVEFRGRPLRTIALTGDDSVEQRESEVAQLEAGELDYILSVDVFNEGVDIPSINQVIMLRQTQSAIVFVQQLGRGLRKAAGKEYLVVIDFIGNYANNFLIPIALFGDDSLNKESLRKNLISAEESGVLPGLSSIRFDRISQERVLRAITESSLDSMRRLKAAVDAMRNRVGGPPSLWDFYRFESVDPVILATKHEHFPALLRKVLKAPNVLSPEQDRALALLSHEVLAGKRLHEYILLDLLLRHGEATIAELREELARAGLIATDQILDSVVGTLTLAGSSEVEISRYKNPVALRDGERIELAPEISEGYGASRPFAAAVDDLRKTGAAIALDRFDRDSLFTVGRQYSRKDALRNLGWPVKGASTVYGYKVDVERGACPVFVTLHKSDDIAASQAYADELIDPQRMRWSSKNNRTLGSKDVAAIREGLVDLHVFVKKDDAEGADHYYLGRATALSAEQTTMPGVGGQPMNVVHFELRFDRPIQRALYDYFRPTVTA